MISGIFLKGPKKKDSGDSQKIRKTSFALRGRESRFKASGNLRIPLAESMEVMAILLSPQTLSNSSTAELAEVASNLKENNGFGSQNFSGVHKPDIVSLLETRVSGAKADKIIAKLGFQFSHRVEAIGFFGGIWLGWNNFVRLKIPWMAIGDFNAILASFEKLGGLNKGRRCLHFGDFVDSVELHDLGFRRPHFTWHRGSLSEHLDRALANEAWIHNFPNCRITHLSRIKLDHRPLLLSFNPNISLPRGSSFRFLVGWFEHPNFDSFFKDSWECSGNFADTLGKFTQKLNEWNKKFYSNIINRKRDLIKRISNTQRKSDYSGSYHLNQEDLALRQELENLLHHEKLLWRQKARCDWLKFGDRNTKYFHFRTMQRRNNNRIYTIWDSEGNWIFEPESIEEEANDFFQKLYREIPAPLGTLPPNRFPQLDPRDISYLGKPVSNEEIKVALFDMALLKASGNDSFHALFFKKQ
ncbi:hypothetical protein J1N35_013613 [Gossypium stocksii]|uniref:Endonuclease/exonuclease/phosphatase domain-containing protein n=1 Tax=Gossypium stocksii TaxID=47602 RepID=A0A9D3VSS3_9ROSI|nr:hypothetical protein J1N35_013613 [Gossypium stocksii]